MSKLLVLGDIHGRNFWRKAIKENSDKVDRVIFLGDYLDPYGEEMKSNPDSMECDFFGDCDGLLNMLDDIIALKKSDPDKYILLTGNHTDSYIWPNFNAATRTDHKHYEEYHNFFIENLDCFNLVHVENNVIFSHAGITEGWAQEVWEQLEYPKDELSSVMEIAIMFQDTPLNYFDKNYIYLISNISHYRWGNSNYGSCEWADLREHLDVKNSTPDNLIALGEDGIYQVFGHTQLKQPLITNKWTCLDCKQGFVFDTRTYECNGCL